MRDVESPSDLRRIVSDFYDRLLTDEILSPLFEKFNDDQVLKDHLDELVDFWNGVLFYRGNYAKNVMAIHQELNKTSPLDKIHFERWLFLFGKAVDSNFMGELAETLKNRARSIATVMQIKLKN